jgi:hypothetical protein
MTQTREWPALPLDKWQDTYDTLHMWTQMVGKLCLALTPRSNHYWNIAFQVTSRGLLSPVMIYEGRSITMVFDFLKHQLEISCADGAVEHIALEPKTVATFYQELMGKLHTMGIDQKIWKMPVEFPNPIAFDKDEVHRSYDPEMASAFHQTLLSMKPVMESFRCGFVGKCSPVHFFWGSFDLAVSRFSGKRAPAKPELGEMYAEGYSHEVISHGFWPGGGPVQEAAFYAYCVPFPEGYAQAKIEPSAAYFHEELKEFILPYEAVRTASSPEEELLKFMNSTYDTAANLAKWNRSDLERARS